MKNTYWVIIPQGIYYYRSKEDLDNDQWYKSSNMLVVHTIKEANKIMIDYNGAYYEKVICKDHKRFSEWLQTDNEDSQLTLSELWEKYEKFPSHKIIG